MFIFNVSQNIYRLLSTKMNSQNQILKESEFSKIFSQKLVQKVENLKILSIEKLYIKTKYNEDENQHFLENAYSEYKNEPTELDEIIQKYLNITDSLYSPETELKIENSLPVIKDYRYLDEVNQLRADSETQQLYEKYNDNLYIFYVEDTETCINYLNEDDLKFLNITFSELREIAIQNLKNFEIEKHGENGYYMIIADGNYEASLILLDIWSQENFPVTGEIIIGIPARDLVLITGSEDFENIKRLKNTIQEINEEGNHIVSEKIFILQNGKFEIL